MSRSAAQIVVGVSDMAVSDSADATIITHALGSCVAVTVFDPELHVGGMLHFMLPDATGDPAKAQLKPAMYGATGIPLLFKRMYELGAVKERMIVCAAGGAEVLAQSDQFRVGQRNRTILRKLFWKNNVLLHADDTGGDVSRTLLLRLSDGAVTVRSEGKERALWAA